MYDIQSTIGESLTEFMKIFYSHQLEKLLSAIQIVSSISNFIIV